MARRGHRKENVVQIIVIPHRLAKAHTISVSLRHVLATISFAILLLAGLTAGLYWLTIRFAADLKIPYLQQLVLAAEKSESERAREFVQQNLNAMAIKLGEMQAQLTRLDAVGERLSTLAGLKPQEYRLAQTPGLGGASATLMPPQNLTLLDFDDKLAEASQRVESRTDALGVLESQLLDQAVKSKLIPTMMPVAAPFKASGFGQRVDPFTGQWAMHEGIDFLAEVGTQVLAAAGGVVAYAGFHPQYGYMVDIDHGNDLVTRYAHCSKLLVKEGDVVKRGRKIAETGTTGRSTGPHLHFEVRFKGIAQNPSRFLAASNTTPPVVAARAAEHALAQSR
jgi:murein DD-endopeptidase MepM/ murein hydrolase activator NlpD